MKRLLVPTLASLAFIIITSACTASILELSDRAWSGTWQGTGQGASQGTLTITFGGRSEFGTISTFDVEMTVRGPQCASPGSVHGDGRQAAAELPPSVRFAVQIGSSVYRFEGTRSGTSMSGTYARIAGSCTDCDCGLGGSGTWQAFS